MTPQEFIRKWSASELKERSGSQEHLIDLCRMLGQPTPADADPEGTSYTFEKGAAKHGGGEGWADVWKKGHFAWEYKGKHKDLEAAYDQLLRYRESLDNPPLLVVSDMDRFEVHTNFTGTAKTVHAFALTDLTQEKNRKILEALFVDPERLKPGTRVEEVTERAASEFASLADLTQEKNRKILEALFVDPERLKPGTRVEEVTERAASEFASLAESLRSRGVEPRKAAHFLDRILFCLFAEDVGLLPGRIFAGGRGDPPPQRSPPGHREVPEGASRPGRGPRPGLRLRELPLRRPGAAPRDGEGGPAPPGRGRQGPVLSRHPRRPPHAQGDRAQQLRPGARPGHRLDRPPAVAPQERVLVHQGPRAEAHRGDRVPRRHPRSERRRPPEGGRVA